MSGADIDSMLQINLNTQSKGDLDEHLVKDKFVKRTLSIVESVKEQSKKQPKQSPVVDPSIKNYSNNMSVKISK